MRRYPSAVNTDFLNVHATVNVKVAWTQGLNNHLLQPYQLHFFAYQTEMIICYCCRPYIKFHFCK